MSDRASSGRRILLTGGTGYIGGAVGRALKAAGHEVVALAHRPGAAEAARGNGWDVLEGGLRDADQLTRAARETDVVVHTANTGGEDAARVDAAATHAFLAGLAEHGGRLVYTSGVWVLGPESTDESSETRPIALAEWRKPLERDLVDAAEDGVTPIVLRPGIVWGEDGGIPGMLGREEIPVVGDGTQRWPLVHLDDLAHLYVRALESPAGSILHAVTETRTMMDVATWAREESGRSGPPPSKSMEDARAALGPFADALALDQEVSSERTRQLTGWSPTRHMGRG